MCDGRRQRRRDVDDLRAGGGCITSVGELHFARFDGILPRLQADDLSRSGERTAVSLGTGHHDCGRRRWRKAVEGQRERAGREHIAHRGRGDGSAGGDRV